MKNDLDAQNIGMQWYVVHTYSGYEDKVTDSIRKIVENRGLGHLIEEVRVLKEKVSKVGKDGKETEKETKLLPGYVLIRMQITDESWHVVRNITGVTGFVGPGSRPTPLTQEEVERLFGAEAAAPKKHEFAVGDEVTITNDEVYGGRSGFIVAVDEDKKQFTIKIPSPGRDKFYVVSEDKLLLK